jgi:hypothetical protein
MCDYLEEEERGVEEGIGAGDVVHELVKAGEGRLDGVTEVVKADVGFGLDKQHALAGAVARAMASQSTVAAWSPPCWKKWMTGTWNRRDSWSSMSESSFSSRGVGVAGATSTAGCLRTRNDLNAIEEPAMAMHSIAWSVSMYVCRARQLVLERSRC